MKRATLLVVLSFLAGILLGLTATKRQRRPMLAPPPVPTLTTTMEQAMDRAAELPRLTIRMLTNENPVVNEAFSSSDCEHVYVRTNEVIITTNTVVDIDAKVMCPVALSLRWFGQSGFCYQVQASTNLKNWVSNYVYRVGTGQEIEFLAPTNGPITVYRLLVKSSPF